MTLSFTGTSQSQTFELDANGRDTINYINYKGYKVGKWVLRGKHKPTSGFPLDQKIEMGNYVNNRKDGIWIEYYKNGKERSKLTYVNGVLEGDAIFYSSDGKISSQGKFKGNKWVNK